MNIYVPYFLIERLWGLRFVFDLYGGGGGLLILSKIKKENKKKITTTTNQPHNCEFRGTGSSLNHVKK